MLFTSQIRGVMWSSSVLKGAMGTAGEMNTQKQT